MPQLSVVSGTKDSSSDRLAARIVAEESRGLLRFLTCGSVDDGKSTLIGRLLYDSALVFEDQLHQWAGGRDPSTAARMISKVSAQSIRCPSPSSGVFES